MNDILPDEVGYWHRLESVLRELTAAYGYREIRTPILEQTELFCRSIGEQTDIVDKEMYTFSMNDRESLTMRPEMTASCCRAGIQHGLFHNRQVRLWYLGPMFRHEKPQKGRYRQFHQFGIEAFGWPGPDLDAELLMLSARLWRMLELRDIDLELNSLGTPATRKLYQQALVAYLQDYASSLDKDSQRRLTTNPLRILDSKDPQTQSIVAGAPKIVDFFDQESADDFDRLREILDSLGIDYRVNPALVRGLDYYSKTVFEWVTAKLGAQNAVCAGGRYDLLVETLGGRPTPGAGFALGLERLIELMRLAERTQMDAKPDVYMVLLGGAAELKGMALAESLRDQGFRVQSNIAGGTLKKQLKRADQSGAKLTLMLGEQELQSDQVLIKPLRTGREQVAVDSRLAVSAITNMLRQE